MNRSLRQDRSTLYDSSVETLLTARLHSAEDWDWPAFRQVLINHASAGEFAAATPKVLRLGDFLPHLEEIRRLCSDAREHGRFGLVDIATGQFGLGRMCHGTANSVEIRSWGPYSRKAVMMIHGHPIGNGRKVSNGELNHFSGQDFQGFMRTRSLLASIVVTPELFLLKMKTSATPTELSDQQIIKRIESAERELLGFMPRARDLKTFTKLLCLEFGLSLYVSNGHGPDELRKVNIFAGL